MAAAIGRATGARDVRLEQRLQALWGGYGELWRATLTQPGDQELSVIVKRVRPPNDDGSVSHRRKLRSYEVERAFYARYAPRCAESPTSRVAAAVALQRDADGWLFVLEDLDASGFAERSQRADAASLGATLRWLARFHARFLGTAPDGLWKVGTYWHLATRPEELGQMRHDALRQAAPSIDRALSGARFRTLVHGDAKLENVCLGVTDAALVDFQYVGGGVGVKDVAYLLHGFSPRETEQAVPSYLDDYFCELRSALVALGSGVDANEVEREWRALFPLAWVDFYRFLLGWSPGQFDRHAYSERLTREVLTRLTAG